MSRDERPGQWDLITDSSSDPVPWTTDDASDLAFHYRLLAFRCSTAASEMRDLKGDDLGEGKAMEALADMVGRLPQLLDDAEESYGKARDAFEHWKNALETARSLSQTKLDSAVSLYNGLDEDEKKDWDGSNGRETPNGDLYSDFKTNVIDELQAAADEAAGMLDDATRSGLGKLWDGWNEVVEWIEENPIIYAVAMIVLGIVAIFVPFLGLALAIFALAVSATSLFRKDKLGWNMETVLTLGLDVLSVFAAGKALAMVGKLGGAVQSGATRMSGTVNNAISRSTAGLRSTAAGQGISNIVNRTSRIGSAINQGTFRNSPKLSLALDMGISATREAAFSGASDVAIQMSQGNGVDFGTAAVSAATGVPGGVVQAGHDHNAFSSAMSSLGFGDTSLAGTGATDMNINSTDSPTPSHGDLGGVSTDFSGDGGSISTGDGTTTTISSNGDGGNTPTTPSTDLGGVSTPDASSPSSTDFSTPDASSPSNADFSTPDISSPSNADFSTPDISSPSSTDFSTPTVDPVSTGDLSPDATGPSPSVDASAPSGNGSPDHQGAPSSADSPSVPSNEPAQTARTDLGDNGSVSTHFDADGRVTGSEFSTTPDNRSDASGYSLTTDADSSTTTIETTSRPERGQDPATTSETTVHDSGATQRTGDGELSLGSPSSSPDGAPSAHYSHSPSSSADDAPAPSFTADLSRQGQATIGNGDGAPTTEVSTGNGSIGIQNPDAGGVRVDGGNGTLSLTGPGGSPGPRFDPADRSVAVDADAGPVSATPRSGGGTETTTPDGVRVSTSPDPDAPGQITQAGEDATVLQAGGSGATVALAAAGAAHAGGAHSSVIDPGAGRTSEVGSRGTRVSKDGVTHEFALDRRGGPVLGLFSDAPNTGMPSAGSIRDGDVHVRGDDPRNPGVSTDLQVRRNEDGTVTGQATAAGTQASVAPDGSATYTHTVHTETDGSVTSTGQTTSVQRTADGTLHAGATTASPDGTVRHPDFTLHPDGTLTVPEGASGSWSQGPGGTQVFTTGDGTTAMPGAGALTPDGWIIGPSGNGGVAVSSPPNPRGDSLTVTHGPNGSLHMESGGFTASGGSDGLNGSTPDGFEFRQDADGLHAGDGTHTTDVSRSGDSRTYENTTGATVAEHTQGTGSAHLPDGPVVRDDGGPGRIEVPQGQTPRFTVDGTSTSVSFTSSGTAQLTGAAPDGSSGPLWHLDGARDGTITGFTPGADLVSHPNGNTDFHTGPPENGHQGSLSRDGVLGVQDRGTGNGYRGTEAGVTVYGPDGADGRPEVRVGAEATEIRTPGSDTRQRVDYGQNGRVDSARTSSGDDTVRVAPEGNAEVFRPVEQLHVDAYGNPHVSVQDTTVAQAQPGTFQADHQGTRVDADGSTTGIGSDRSRIVHGGDGDGIVSVDRNGYHQEFGPDGPVQQHPTSQGRFPTQPTVTRDGDRTVVEQQYTRRGAEPVEGPVLSTDGTTTSIEHDGYSASRATGDEGTTTSVRPSQNAPTVSRSSDGTTVVEGDNVRVERSPEPGSDGGRSVDIRPAGDQDGLRVERNGDGSITVFEGDRAILDQAPGHPPLGPDGRPLDASTFSAQNTEPGGALPVGDSRMHQSWDGISVQYRDPATGEAGSRIEIRPDGSFTYTNGNERVDVSSNGIPRTRAADGDGGETTVRETNDGQLDIRDRRREGAGHQQTTTSINGKGAIETRIGKPSHTTESGQAESWGVGIDKHNQATSINNRPLGDSPITLTPEGNTSQTPLQASEFWNDIREQQNGSKQNSDAATDRIWRNLEVGGETALVEMAKAVANTTLAAALQYLDPAQEVDWATHASQIATAAPRGFGDGYFGGRPGMPEHGAGMYPWSLVSEVSHQSMRNAVADGWHSEYGQDPFEAALSTDEEEYREQRQRELEREQEEG